MVILDVAIVNVALPSMRSGLHFSTTGLQWVVNAYTLTFAGFLMLGGRSADLLGRRRVFLVGTAMFAVSSLGCALADSRDLLIAARAVQGLSGAVLSPATLSIITASFAEGRERNRGLAAWGAVGGLGASSGALLGGVLTQAFGWPAIFAVNVPLGIVVVALGSRLIPATARAEGTRHFDLTGAALVTASLVSLTYGIVRTDTLGWGAPGVIVPLIGGVALLAAFLLVEARFAREPLVPLSIFRIGHLRAANAVVLLLYASQFPGWFFLTLYMQQVLHYDAIEAGLGFLPMTLSIFVGVDARAASGGPLRTAPGDRHRHADLGGRASAAERRRPGRDLREHGPARCAAVGARDGLHARPRDDRRDAGRRALAERRRVGPAQHLAAGRRRARAGRAVDDRGRRRRAPPWVRLRPRSRSPTASGSPTTSAP